VTPLLVAVEIIAQPDGDRFWRSSQSIDPARLLFKREIPLERGSSVQVTFELPDGEPIRAGGTVSGPNEIQYITSAATNRAIAHYIATPDER
jgi:hypothetical protein